MTRSLATSCLSLLCVLTLANNALGRPIDWSDGNQRLAYHHSAGRSNPTTGDESQSAALIVKICDTDVCYQEGFV